MCLQGKTVTLKLKTSTFHVTTQAKSLPLHTSDVESISVTALNLLEQNMKSAKTLKLRLMGVRMSSLLDEVELAANRRVKQFTLDAFLQTEHGNDNLYVCPMCGHKERSLTVLNKHAESCIDLFSEPVSSKSVETEIPIADWTCPVCEQKVIFKEGDEASRAFNDHLDNCLNRKAVKEVLDSEKKLYGTNSKKVLRSKHAQRGASKKCKLGEASTSYITIDKFLTIKASSSTS